MVVKRRCRKKCWVKDERRAGAAGSVPEGPLSRPRKRELSGLESKSAERKEESQRQQMGR